MSGIVFFATRDLARMRAFYVTEIGMRERLAVADVTIFSHGNLEIGFHETGSTDAGAMICLVYPDREEVNRMHERLAAIADAPARADETYRIYHFFARDPEGRRIEIQSFDDPMEPSMDGEELLHTRRSVREFRDRPVDDATLAAILESCRLAPSARNSQPVEFVVIRDRATLERLAALRPGSSDPIGRAPLAVAVVSDPAVSPRPAEDGCIAAYHLLLAAWLRGLGTCWIGGTDVEAAKRILGVPRNRILTTITPLGWPAEKPPVRPRRAANVRFLPDRDPSR